MPKEKILPEKKQEISSFIRAYPTVNIQQLKEKYNIRDGRVLAGIKNYALAKIKPAFQKGYTKIDEPIKKDNSGTEQKPIVKEQKKEENMEQEEINKLLEQVRASTMETVKALKEQDKKTEESLAKEKKAEETLAQIKQLTEKITSLETKTIETDGRIKTFCDEFPGLCKKVEDLAKKLETQPVAPQPQKPEEPKKKGILDTGHETLDELLACPECLLGHIKKIGFDKAAGEICKDNEACKATIAELTKKGYEIGEPKKEEVINEPGKTKEEGGSGFTLGRAAK